MSSPPLQLDESCLDKLIVGGELADTDGPRAVAVGGFDGARVDPRHSWSWPTPRYSPASSCTSWPTQEAPFLYGAGVGVLNMGTMVESYRAPGVALGNQASIDLARWYGLPSWAYAGDSDSKLFDEQSAAEAAMGTVLGELCRATLLHDVGYLESGLQSSYEALVLGDELAGYARAFGEGLPVDDDSLALDEIMLAGPGGNHLFRHA